MVLHPKIQKRKREAAPITYSSVAINERAGDTARFLENLEKRIIEGYLFRWGVPNMHGEKMIKGCCAKSIQERGPDSSANYKITFLNQHRTAEPLALFAELVEDDYGLFFRTKPLDAVRWADDVLTQVRSGTLNQFSGGFGYVWDKMEYDKSDDSLVCLEINLFEGSIVTIGSDSGTHVVRSAEAENELTEGIEFFIGNLQRKQQLEARQLFARHKALCEAVPQNKRKTEDTKPKPQQKRGIDYNYLIKNLKK